MSDGPPTPGQQPTDRPVRDAQAQARERLTRLARRARLTLAWERAWPPIAWALTIAALFLACSWLGLWFAAPPLARPIGVGLFAIALGVALFPLMRLALLATRDGDALARLDRDSGAPHRPASSSLDHLADPAADETTRVLWRLHQRKLAESVASIAVAPPAPRMVDRDRLALRLGALALAVAAGFVAGPEKYARIAAAFDWRAEAAAPQGFRLDAWIDPPAYTGKPPIMLDALGKDAPQGGGPIKVETPVGSTLIFRAQADGDAAVEGALAPVETAKDGKTAPAAQGAQPAVHEQRWTIKGPGKLRISRAGATLSTFEIVGVANHKPAIALTAPPRANARGSLTLAYRLADEYGIAAAEADFARPTINGKAPTGRSLVEPPRLALQLPATAAATGDAETTSDLSDHPWAGAKVMMTLHATDIAGEEGVSEPVEVTLPQRRFENPLARALVEQRRDLILDPDQNRPRVAASLDALLIAPDLFGIASGIYLGLHEAQTSLADARTDADLVAVADLLWAMALQIEDGDASQAERELRAAEQKLREALNRGASDAEIRELMKELRAAAENFARDLAQNAQSPDDSSESDQQTLDEKDLQSMLDRMEDTARTGDKAEAQAMLDQLQDMFENLKGAKKGRASQAQREMRKQLGDLDRLMRDQQKLRDDTFRQDQRERRRGASPDSDEAQPGEDGASPGDQQGDGDGPLDARQKALRERLGELQRRMKDLGLKGEKGFDDAEGAMGEAQGDLQEGPGGKGKAIGPQGRALEALRQGAEGLQRQMQGQGQGEGDSEATGKAGPGQEGRDPLGRDRSNPLGRGATEGRLADSVGAAERARRVLEELRRRLSDPNRPGDERDYLERLLNRN